MADDSLFGGTQALGSYGEGLGAGDAPKMGDTSLADATPGGKMNDTAPKPPEAPKPPSVSAPSQPLSPAQTPGAPLSLAPPNPGPTGFFDQLKQHFANMTPEQKTQMQAQMHAMFQNIGKNMSQVQGNDAGGAFARGMGGQMQRPGSAAGAPPATPTAPATAGTPTTPGAMPQQNPQMMQALTQWLQQLRSGGMPPVPGGGAQANPTPTPFSSMAPWGNTPGSSQG